MKTQYTLALAVAFGFAAGAVAVHGLHAQAKLPAFSISEIEVTNADSFNTEFSPLAQKALAAYGAKALARGGKTASLYGDAPKVRIVINAFDSLDQAVAAFNSKAYKDAKAIGDKYGKFRIYAVEGLAN